MKSVWVGSVVLGSIFFLGACAPDSGGLVSSLAVDEAAGDESEVLLKRYSEAGGRSLRLNLTDGRRSSAKMSSVIVHVDYVELFVQKNGVRGRLRVAEGLGPIDLETLAEGRLGVLDEMVLPAGLTLTEVRMVLRREGHEGWTREGRRCDLKTPSAQQSGLKLKLRTPVTIKEGRAYSFVLDFDSDRSVVIKGHGGCLLKPVLRLRPVTSVVSPIEEQETVVDDEVEAEQIESEGDGNGESGGEDFGETESPTDPPVITIEDSFLIP